MFLYPLKDTQSRLDRVPSERDGGAGRDASSGIYYMKQRIGNACGTVAILHAIGNNLADTGGAVRIIPGSYLEGFFRATRVLSPEEIATQCIADEGISKYYFAFQRLQHYIFFFSSVRAISCICCCEGSI